MREIYQDRKKKEEAKVLNNIEKGIVIFIVFLILDIKLFLFYVFLTLIWDKCIEQHKKE